MNTTIVFTDSTIAALHKSQFKIILIYLILGLNTALYLLLCETVLAPSPFQDLAVPQKLQGDGASTHSQR